MATDNGGYPEKELLSMIRKWVTRDRVPKRVRVKDTADFFRVDENSIKAAIEGSIKLERE